jgi:hypothetical protein
MLEVMAEDEAECVYIIVKKNDLHRARAVLGGQP